MRFRPRRAAHLEPLEWLPQPQLLGRHRHLERIQRQRDHREVAERYRDRSGLLFMRTMNGPVIGLRRSARTAS
jgi:hypothetical protein